MCHSHNPAEIYHNDSTLLCQSFCFNSSSFFYLCGTQLTHHTLQPVAVFVENAFVNRLCTTPAHHQTDNV